MILPAMKKVLGFTIIELMTVVAVLGVALAIGVPTMSDFLLNNRLVSDVNSLSSALTLARSEAIKQNQRVVVCASTDKSTCNAGSVWETGWIVFVDRNANLLPDYGADGCADGATDDCLLIAEAALPGAENAASASGHKIVVRSGTAIGNAISYNGSGVPRCAGAACTPADSLFTICDRRGATHARALAISQTGRASVTETRLDGTALTCP